MEFTLKINYLKIAHTSTHICLISKQENDVLTDALSHIRHFTYDIMLNIHSHIIMSQFYAKKMIQANMCSTVSSL